MLVVTGANGALGRRVVEALLGRLPADRIGVSVRDPEAARDLRERGVRVRRGDFTDPEGLAQALEGATRMLLVSMNSVDHGIAGHRAALDAAARAGVGHVVYTGHMGAGVDSPFAPMRTHAATLAALEASGLPFTFLRNGFYASTVVRLVAGALESGELRTPEDAPVAWTDHVDLADAAVAALTGDDPTGVSPPLTGREAVDMDGVASLLGELDGRAVRRVVVSDAEYRADLVGRGVPEQGADMLVGMFAASRRGDFAPADPALGRLLDRQPVSLREVLAPLVGRAGAATG